MKLDNAKSCHWMVNFENDINDKLSLRFLTNKWLIVK